MDARMFGKQGGKFLRKFDLRDGGPRRLRITGVESVENKFAAGEQVLQLVCEDGTRLDLRTRENQDRIMGFFGHDTNDWIGQIVEAYFDPQVRSPSGERGGVRLRLPARPPEVATFVSDLEAPPARPNGADRKPDEIIPF